MTAKSGTIVVCGFPVRWHGEPPTPEHVAEIHAALSQMVADVVGERLAARRAANAQ